MYKKMLVNWSKSVAAMLAVFSLLFMSGLAQAQTCNPSVTGDPCEGSFLNFKANSPGANTYSWDFGGQGTSADRDPVFTFPTAGTYNVKLDTDGPLGKCSKTISVVVKPSPVANISLVTSSQQCFEGNEFCWEDNSDAAPGSTIDLITFVTEDGGRYDFAKPSKGLKICHTVIDPRGGTFDITVEITDANGCITRVTYPDAMTVWPRMGVELLSSAPVECDSSKAIITNNTYVKWLGANDKYIGLKDVASFTYDFGDGVIITGDSNTNTEWWTGDNLDGRFEKWYRENGTFDAVLTVESKFGCTESFKYRAAATTIKIRPEIVSNKDSACTDDSEIIYTLLGGPYVGARITWNLGDPLQGDPNFPFGTTVASLSYGAGPWMARARLEIGPCDVDAFDTILIVGPTSTIGVANNHILEEERYQCIIRDSVHMVNNSSFYHNDPLVFDEDSFVIDKDGIRRHVFDFDSLNRPVNANSQLAVPHPSPIRNKDHVYRLWTLGDNFAPQCTTHTRINKNVGLNCNFNNDSLPVHWYRPWDDIYEWERNGNFYKTPAPRTLFSLNGQKCSKIQVYRDSVVVIPKEVIVFAPFDSAYTFNITYVDSFGVPGLSVINLSAATEYDEIQDSTYFRLRILRPKSVYKGPVIHTAIWDDQDYEIPANTTIKVKNLNNGTVVNVSGARALHTIEMDNQFEVAEGDSIISLFKVIVMDPDTVIAQPSTYTKDTVINGVDSFVVKTEIYIDKEYHRQKFFLDNGQCNNVTLFHKDTVHPFQCEHSTSEILALLPPNAQGLTWRGTLCPLSPDPNTILTFSMEDTKPGCTQQWMEVVYDSLTGPNNWISAASGGVLAPPKPGLPIPFNFPYQMIGPRPNQFLKGYAANEIGNDPSFRPNGSFTVGLIIGNGPPATDPNTGNPIAPECTDTVWYKDFFRYLYLNADFEILIPNQERKSMCVGDTAVFRILNPRQDSVKSINWSFGTSEHFQYGYFEIFNYWEEYEGPVKGRNDEGFTLWDDKYKGQWLYNYVIRDSIDDEYKFKKDTIVTHIFMKYRTVIDKGGIRDELKERFESEDLVFEDIPAEDFERYFGDRAKGTGGCVDTTGLSDLFRYGRKKIETLTVKYGDTTYQYSDSLMKDSSIVDIVFHFRDTMLHGYDTIIAPYKLTSVNGDIKKGEKVPGVYTHVYHRKVIEKNECFPNDKQYWDTLNEDVRGAMNVSLIVTNSNCLVFARNQLNVGLLNYIKLDNYAVCQNEVHRLYDSVRYWQYNNEFPRTDPIDPREWWGIDYVARNKEIKTVNWDFENPSSKWDRSIDFEHIYPDTGKYEIAFATIDSLGCEDTIFTTAMVTGVDANFEINGGLNNCISFIDFYDSTVVFDPCSASDTCPNRPYDPCDSVLDQKDGGYNWDFGDGSLNSKFKDPTHNYTSAGWYTVTLTVKTLLGCVDSIKKQIFIDGPQPFFEFENDHPVWGQDSIIVCVGDPVTLVNLSEEPMFDPEWSMNWGDSSFTSHSNVNTNPVHAYSKAGRYELILNMEDHVKNLASQRCQRVYPDTSTADGKEPRKIIVIVRPKAESNLTIVDTIVCPDDVVTYTSNSDTIYKRFTWSFGDGDTATRALPVNSVSHSYSSPGTYNVVMIPDYDPVGFEPRCLDTAYGTVLVQEVIADFTIDDSERPNFCFNDASTGAVKWTWFIETETGEIIEVEEQNTCYNWGEKKGEYEVCLIVENALGCKDTTCQTILNDFVANIKPYNIFTPDGEDELNKEFVVESEGIEEYEIKIFNRWGELVFESEDETVHWNGKIKNIGNDCPEGTYFYIINYKLKARDQNDGLEPISGQVTLIRD